MTTDNADSHQPLPPPLPQQPPQMMAAYPVGYWPLPVPPGPPPPRVWPAIVVPLAAIVAALVASSAALVAAAISELGTDGITDHARFMAWVTEYGATPDGFLMLVLPGQLTFLAAALLAGVLSRTPTRERLGLTRPRTPWWAIPLLLLATPFAGICGDLLATALFGDDRGEQLEMLHNLFRGHSGAMLVLVTLAVSVLPGFGEELLFRGYTQRRLLESWHPVAAIGLTSLLFAAAHFDFVHIVGVLPLGIWLGVVAWLSGSIWPAVICHAVNNATAVLVTNAGVVDMTEHVRFDAFGLTMIGVTGTFLALSVWVMWRNRVKTAAPGLASTNVSG